MSGLEFDAHAQLDLSAAVDMVGNRVARELRRHAPSPAPVFARYGANGVVGSDGVLTLRLGGPDQGHYWYVRSVTVGGIDPTLAAAGQADLFVSASALDGAPVNAPSPSLLDWRDRATRLPIAAFFGVGELELRLNEELFVRFTGATVGQTYAAGAQIEDHQEQAGPQTWDN